MKISAKFDHFNINVQDLQRSIDFYNKALGLSEVSRYEPEDKSFTLAYLGDGKSPFRLELTCLKSHTDHPYELGENESHICFRVSGDYTEARRFHKQMGCVCFENETMGLYFIEDPDGYWIEVLPEK